MTELAADPPMLRIYVRTYEPGSRERQAQITISVADWELITTKQVHLQRLEEMLDEAADAAHHAHRLANGHLK